MAETQPTCKVLARPPGVPVYHKFSAIDDSGDVPYWCWPNRSSKARTPVAA